MDTELERYVQAYPQARAALEFLQAIVTYQAAQAAKVEPGPPIAPEAARERWQAGLPLLDEASLSAPYPWLHGALVALRPVLSQHAQAQLVLDRVASSGLAEPSSAGSFPCDLSRNGRDRIEHLAVAISADPEMLTLVLHTAIAPFYRQRAAPYREWLVDLAWRYGYCPLCGSEPSMARLAQEDGRRVLMCSLCRSEWSFDRLRCPYCEADGRPQLRHFTVDGDPGHRVDCCVQCRGYLKVVDQRVVHYDIYLPAEEIVTAHLDGLARDQGYQ